jgi:subtilisin family serine protease
MDNVISVAAMNYDNALASFSNYGYFSVHLAAPGVGIVTTSLNGSSSGSNAGTSYAAPFVTALCAMLMSLRPDLDYTQIRRMIIEGSTEIPVNYGQTPDYSKRYIMCSGSFNAFNTLTGVKSHDIVSNDNWTPPQSIIAAEPESEGSSGSTICFISTAGS